MEKIEYQRTLQNLQQQGCWRGKKDYFLRMNSWSVRIPWSKKGDIYELLETSLQSVLQKDVFPSWWLVVQSGGKEPGLGSEAYLCLSPDTQWLRVLEQITYSY